MLRTPLVLLVATLLAPLATAAEPGAGWAYMNHDVRRLHSDETVNLRARYAGQPLLIINTASFCGFSGQFRKLEALHQEYRERGLKVVGFPSDDFKQEAAEEKKTAEVCYKNYGVSFDMYQPVGVRGKDAHPVFQELARQAGAPRWNFYKYVVDRQGRVVAQFPSQVEPDAAEVRTAIDQALQSKP